MKKISCVFFQELFNSSKTVLWCISSSRFRVIHRSLLFDAIRDPKLLKDVLEALAAKNAKKASRDATKETPADDGGKEGEERDQSNRGNIMLISKENKKGTEDGDRDHDCHVMIRS